MEIITPMLPPDESQTFTVISPPGNISVETVPIQNAKIYIDEILMEGTTNYTFTGFTRECIL